jgi:hypothetical protein
MRRDAVSPALCRWWVLARAGGLRTFRGLFADWRNPAPEATVEHLFAYAPPVADLPIPELVENRRRSIAMLPRGVPALDRDEALELLGQLEAALVERRELRAQGEAS